MVASSCESLNALQYAAAIHADKLKRYLHKLMNKEASVGVSRFNMRLALQADSDELTGVFDTCCNIQTAHAA